MEEISKLRDILRQLRAPGGCPWDREQDHYSLRASLIEEAYEVVEAINRHDDINLREELGDLLFVLFFHTVIAEERGLFTLEEVAADATAKLIHRHPHVFGPDAAQRAAEMHAEDVVRSWEQIKALEAHHRGDAPAGPESLLQRDAVALPGLMRGFKVATKAARAGFAWEGVADIINKVLEETDELSSELHASPQPNYDRQQRIEEELGDLLFTITGLAQSVGVNPELALHRAIDRFRDRFQTMEQLAREEDLDFVRLSAEQKDRLWREAKRLEILKQQS